MISSVTGLRVTRPSQPEAGFTLVETLAALAVFATLAVLLSATTRLGLKAWQTASGHFEWADQSSTVQHALRTIIAASYPYYRQDHGARGAIEFAGRRQSLDLISAAPLAVGGAGRYRFALRLDRHDGRSDLVLKASPELVDPDHPGWLTTSLLLADIKGVDLSYFGSSGSDDGASWRDDWLSRAKLPRLVRVRVSFRDGDARRWPEIVVAPRIGADVDCAMDSLTADCRGR